MAMIASAAGGIRGLRTKVALPSMVSTIPARPAKSLYTRVQVPVKRAGNTDVRSLIGIFSVGEYPRRETVLTSATLAPPPDVAWNAVPLAGPWILLPTGLSCRLPEYTRTLELDGRARWSSRPR